MKRPRKKQNAWRKVVRTDAFSLFQNRARASLWRINWKDAETKWRRFRVSAASVEEATATARNLVAGIDPEKPAPDEDGLLVIEAFDAALADTRRGECSRKAWQGVKTAFIAWLAEQHPAATHWSMISRTIIRQYMAPMAGKAPNTIRLAMNPIVQTAGFMEAEHGLANPTRRLRIGNKLAKTPPMVFLTDVAAFLDWLRENQPRLEAGAALQGLCGLQLQEATRLTWDRVDLERGLVEISGEVKNQYRNRVIPVCSRALAALSRAAQQRAGRKARPLEPQTVLVSAKGHAFDEGSWLNHSKELGAAIRAWNPGIGWAPKDLRNCLLQLAAADGWAGAAAEQYVGHAPAGVTGRHYLARLTAVSRGESEALERQMRVFRERVVEPVEAALGQIARKSHEGAGNKTESGITVLADP